MASVQVLGLDVGDPELDDHGEHVWLMVEFSSGVFINVRVDEFTAANDKDWSSRIVLKKGRGSGYATTKEVSI